VVPTASIATLMWLGTVGLLVWDLDRWRALFVPSDRALEVRVAPPAAPIDMTLWTRCGIAMLVVYLGSAIGYGGVYRPRGLELDEPAFYVMPAILLLPLITLVIDQRRTRRSE
jgi:hypothetical protein